MNVVGKNSGLLERLAPQTNSTKTDLQLDSGSRVAVIGGGPAGTFFSYFLLDMARRVGIDLQLDIYERKDFSVPGPGGCNMCGGIVSESLVQTLAAEGINLPSTVVERGIDSYVLHMDDGSVRIDTPLHEKRIAAVHRGAGPKGIKELKWLSFDGHLLELAVGKGARVVRGLVDAVSSVDGRPHVKTKGGDAQAYDLLCVAVGVNSATLKLFEQPPIRYKPPRTTRTYIGEFYFGEEVVEKYLGSSMHVFLLNMSRLEFGALVPKGDFITLCMLGRDIDDHLVRSFLGTPEVQQCLPPGWHLPEEFCHCSPRINVHRAAQPYGDRMVFIGDCGVTRLYKDGIGAAYRTAKAAATTALFEGISSESFKQHYGPICDAIHNDNRLGKLIFAFTRQIQRIQHDRRGVLRMVAQEQKNKHVQPRMSMVLWDTFTGSAPYREIFLRTLNPAFLGSFIRSIVAESWPFNRYNSARLYKSTEQHENIELSSSQKVSSN